MKNFARFFCVKTIGVMKFDNYTYGYLDHLSPLHHAHSGRYKAAAHHCKLNNPPSGFGWPRVAVHGTTNKVPWALFR
jgi:hypothetical protein